MSRYLNYAVSNAVATAEVSSEFKFNVGTAIPVNPLSAGQMLLVNTAYQTRSGVAGLMSHARMTSSVLKDIVFSIRTLNNMIDDLEERSEVLLGMVEDLVEDNERESDASLCDLGSQALSAAASLCYVIPGINVAFGSMFSYASDLVDWFGESVKHSRKLENFNMRRTAFFDNVNSHQYADELGKRLRNLDDSVEQMEYVNGWLCNNEHALYETEQWILNNPVIEEGFNFFGIQDEYGITSKNTLGILFPCVANTRKSVKLCVIDLAASTLQISDVNDLSDYKVESRMSLNHFMRGAARSGKIIKVSSTPIFISDGMLEQRFTELRTALGRFSDNRETRLCQIHAFLQLGGESM